MKRLIILGLIILSLFVLGCESKDSAPIEVEKYSLTLSEKEIICNDIVAYTEWCYDNGVSLDDCVSQIEEKTIRLYDLSVAEYQEVVSYCNS